MRVQTYVGETIPLQFVPTGALMTPQRKLARDLAREAIQRGRPLEWFEQLYASAQRSASMVPWADLEVNPNLAQWLARQRSRVHNKTCLIVGCGLGDDAVALRDIGYQVVAFDISESCIAWCRSRFKESQVRFEVADLFQRPESWHEHFDFVLESYTLQVLPKDLRPAAIHQISSCVAPGGTLLVITRGRDASDDEGNMPWPLLQSELDDFVGSGMSLVSFEDYVQNESPPIRRFRVEYKRNSS